MENNQNTSNFLNSQNLKVSNEIGFTKNKSGSMPIKPIISFPNQILVHKKTNTYFQYKKCLKILNKYFRINKGMEVWLFTR